MGFWNKDPHENKIKFKFKSGQFINNSFVNMISELRRHVGNLIVIWIPTIKNFIIQYIFDKYNDIYKIFKIYKYFCTENWKLIKKTTFYIYYDWSIAFFSEKVNQL